VGLGSQNRRHDIGKYSSREGNTREHKELKETGGSAPFIYSGNASQPC